MDCRTAIAFFVAVLMFGCATPQPYVNETYRLAELHTLPHHMVPHQDLIEISDANLVFDLSAIPEQVGIPLVKYNPFDPNKNAISRTALCPFRTVFATVLHDGISRSFVPDKALGETVIQLIPQKIGITKVDGGALCSISLSAVFDGERVAFLETEERSLWRDESSIPYCAYAAAVSIGDRLFAVIASSQRLRDKIAESRKGGGSPPVASQWSFSDIAGNGFGGSVIVSGGSWGMGRIQQWTRAQIEQTARARLGVRSLENYRILLTSVGEGSDGGTILFRFRVFPYRGFELSYDSQTRRGRCVADLAFLGVSEVDGYNKAVQYVETILNDQGTIRRTGDVSVPAHYRFDGYRTTGNGTKIELPFVLVQ